MSVKLRLKRMGRSHQAFFRLNAIDSRSPRDGRVIEQLGHYDPRHKDQSKQFVVKLDRCKHWLDVGAVIQLRYFRGRQVQSIYSAGVGGELTDLDAVVHADATDPAPGSNIFQV